MVQPKIIIKVPFVLCKLFNKSFERVDLIKLQKDTEKFAKLVNKNKEQILSSIEKYTGFSWQRENIFVYICKDFSRFGISEPLIIKYDESDNWMLYILVHELVHINVFDANILSLITRSNTPDIHVNFESLVNMIAKKVYLQISSTTSDLDNIIKRDKQISADHEKMWAKVDELENNWNVEKIPLKDYL